jgi:sulfate adenylyltransferase
MVDGHVLSHGGKLINSIVSEEEKANILSRSYKKIIVSPWTISDLEMLATGAFSPLRGFMKQMDYEAVLSDMRLENGTVWPLPITLPIEHATASKLAKEDEVMLTGQDGTCYALLSVEEVFRYDPSVEATQIYGTADLKHPGVAKVYGKPPYYVAGAIRMLQFTGWGLFAEHHFTPSETRFEFAKRGWRTIVGFQTRNPIHRAHEYIQKCALETVDGLMLHPLVGETKADDVPADVRMKSYIHLLDRYYPQDRVFLSIYPAAMRYAGPREAIFHALVRKNYGCTHFIVGRDHAGVGNYYGPYDSQIIFQQFSPEEIGIQPLFFEHSFYCKTCQGMASLKTCPHGEEDRLTLSGTKVRDMLRKGQLPPPEFTRPEIAKILADGIRDTS